MNFRVDNLQYCNWSREIFEINHEAQLDAVHATICYHEDYDEVLSNIKTWNTYFEKNEDLIFQGKCSKDIVKANLENKTAIFYGLQNCSPVEDNIDYVESLKELGVLFMPVSYTHLTLPTIYSV